MCFYFNNTEELLGINWCCHIELKLKCSHFIYFFCDANISYHLSIIYKHIHICKYNEWLFSSSFSLILIPHTETIINIMITDFVSWVKWFIFSEVFNLKVFFRWSRILELTISKVWEIGNWVGTHNIPKVLFVAVEIGRATNWRASEAITSFEEIVSCQSIV